MRRHQNFLMMLFLSFEARLALVANPKDIIDAFGRSFLGELLKPSYCEVNEAGALFHTQGGLKIDRNARVCRKSRASSPTCSRRAVLEWVFQVPAIAAICRVTDFWRQRSWCILPDRVSPRI
jgi:hypothetical protein